MALNAYKKTFYYALGYMMFEKLKTTHPNIDFSSVVAGTKDCLNNRRSIWRILLVPDYAHGCRSIQYLQRLYPHQIKAVAHGIFDAYHGKQLSEPMQKLVATMGNLYFHKKAMSDPVFTQARRTRRKS